MGILDNEPFLLGGNMKVNITADENTSHLVQLKMDELGTWMFHNTLNKNLMEIAKNTKQWLVVSGYDYRFVKLERHEQDTKICA